MCASLSIVPLALQQFIAVANGPCHPTEGTPEQLEALVRVKHDGTNCGSYVEGFDSLEATKWLLTILRWKEVAHDQLPAGAASYTARYFRATLPKRMTGRTNILTYRQLSPEQRAQVRLVDGDRGPEMILDWIGQLPETREVWAIVNQHETQWIVLSTWHPGPLTPRLTTDSAEHVRRIISGDLLLSRREMSFIGPLAVRLQQP